jgi:hypothetical protein
MKEMMFPELSHGILAPLAYLVHAAPLMHVENLG